MFGLDKSGKRCGDDGRYDRLAGLALDRGPGRGACGHEGHADANAAAVILVRAGPEPGHQPVTAGRDAA
jgi:transposase